MSEATNPKVRKRKQRAVLSCNDCRRRKLKCDRVLPCNRCVTGNIAEKCAYGDDAHYHQGDADETHSTMRMGQPSLQPLQTTESWPLQPENTLEFHAPTQNSHDRVGQLEQRLATLEALLRAQQNKPDTQKLVDDTQDKDLSTISVALIKGRGYRTFYYGPTSPTTTLAYFPDLRPFMKRVFVGSTLQRLKEDSKASEDQLRLKRTSRKVRFVSDMRSLLPARAVVDKVVETYFNTFETTYRILHGPTFWAAYITYWESPCAPNLDMDAIILAILAATLCTSTHDTTRYYANGSTFRSKAIVWIKACEAWLIRQSNKHRSLATLQVRSLRLLALSTTCLKTKEYYQEIQAHMSFMISSGMHRDPNVVSVRCSVFEAELRRRLWATAVELELQASIDKGTPSILTGLQYDCGVPRNINDSEIYPDMKHLPEPHPASVFTDSSFLHFSIRSIALRIRLCALANSLQATLCLKNTLQDEEEVQKALDETPKWSEKRSLQASTLLDLQLRQFLLLIHLRRTLNTQRKPESRYAILTVITGSEALIDLHLKLIHTDNFALCCIRFDYVRAALLICHIAYHASLASDYFITRFVKPNFESTLDKALKLLEERCLRPGRGNHHYWVISAAISLVLIQFEPQKTLMLEKQATERVCKLLYRQLSLQDEESEDELVQEIIYGDSPLIYPTSTLSNTSAGHNTSLDRPTSNMPTTLLGESGLGTYSDEAMSAWMLDDISFLGDFDEGQGNEKFDSGVFHDVLGLYQPTPAATGTS